MLYLRSVELQLHHGYPNVKSLNQILCVEANILKNKQTVNYSYKTSFIKPRGYFVGQKDPRKCLIPENVSVTNSGKSCPVLQLETYQYYFMTLSMLQIKPYKI